MFFHVLKTLDSTEGASFIKIIQNFEFFQFSKIWSLGRLKLPVLFLN